MVIRFTPDRITWVSEGVAIPWVVDKGVILDEEDWNQQQYQQHKKNLLTLGEAIRLGRISTRKNGKGQR
jgi:hypothetical protein